MAVQSVRRISVLVGSVPVISVPCFSNIHWPGNRRLLYPLRMRRGLIIHTPRYP